MGDHNADPLDGGAAAAELHLQPAIDQLLGCCQVNAGFVPTSEGGRQAGACDGSFCSSATTAVMAVPACSIWCGIMDNHAINVVVLCALSFLD